MTVWTLNTNCNKDLVLRTDIDYFQTHFVGKTMSSGWQPPSIRIDGKRQRVREFVSWMLSAPVVSEKAKDALEELVGDAVEFLPLIALRKKQFYAMNVIHLVDCLDTEKSNIVYAPDEPDHILSIEKYIFIDKKLPNSSIFKIPEDTGVVLVRRTFIDKVIQEGLGGAAFGDPAKNPFWFILRGLPVNVIDDLPQ